MDLNYETGLKELETRLPKKALDVFEAFEQRLIENLRRERLFGGTQTTRSERAEIIYGLNDLARKHLSVSFNDLCQGIVSPPQVGPSESEGGVSPEDRKFVDFLIRVFPKQEASYRVEVTLSDQRQFTSFLSSDILDAHYGDNPVEDGQMLFTALFNGELRDAWNLAKGKSDYRRIRLWVGAGAPELHGLPWELMRDDTLFVAANAKTPFSRYLPGKNDWGTAVVTLPIQVLAMASNPDDLDLYNLTDVDVEGEYEILHRIFRGAVKKDGVLIGLDSPVTLKRVGDVLRNQGCHILHYAGHGQFSSRSGQAALYMQNDDGETAIVRDAKLSEMLALQDLPLRLLFLSACQSAVSTTTNAFMGLGPKLVDTGIPAVVAMRDLVTMETARELSRVFYERLLSHGIVDLALNQARAALLTIGRPDWAVPVLFMRLKSGRLWDV